MPKLGAVSVEIPCLAKMVNVPMKRDGKGQEIMPASYWDGLYTREARSEKGRFRRWRSPGLAELVGHIEDLPTDRPVEFLEVGCAPGRFMIELANRYRWKVGGIELSASGLEILEANLATHGVRARVYAGDVFELEPTELYDVVGSFGLVEHFDDPIPCYRAMSRWIRPGGAMIVTVPNLLGLIGTAMKRRDREHYMSHQRYTPDDLAGHCEAAGFRVVFRGLVGNIYFPGIFDQKTAGVLGRAVNFSSRVGNAVVTRLSWVLERSIKWHSLTEWVGCVAMKDKTCREVPSC